MRAPEEVAMYSLALSMARRGYSPEQIRQDMADLASEAAEDAINWAEEEDRRMAG